MRNMARWYSLFILTSLTCLCSGQIGVNVKTFFGQSKTLDTVGISQNGMQASVEYNFRFKKKRIEFHPALGYRFTWNSSDLNGYFQSYDFEMNTAIYPFDFKSDCHCPTFSKNGELVRKGFFIELNPGVGYQTLSRVKIDPDDPARLPIRSKNVVLKMGGSAGLDIGLSDQFTMTPMLSATFLSSSNWEGLRHDGSIGQLKDYVYWGAGMRVTHHPDPRRRRY